MRLLTRQSVMLAGASLLVAGTAANAAASEIVEVKVPFPLIVNPQAFPAGQYTVEREVSSSVLVIRGQKANHTGALVMTTPQRAGPSRHEADVDVHALRESVPAVEYLGVGP
jgi:hypothetical protein